MSQKQYHLHLFFSLPVQNSGLNNLNIIPLQEKGEQKHINPNDVSISLAVY